MHSTVRTLPPYNAGYGHIYSVMQSDGNSFDGDVVLDSFNMVYSDKDGI